MVATAPLSFDQSRVQVEDMMEQGIAFTRVEDAIEVADLSAAHKAALWLLAWSLRDRAAQLRDARIMLAAVGAGGRRVPVIPALSGARLALTVPKR